MRFTAGFLQTGSFGGIDESVTIEPVYSGFFHCKFLRRTCNNRFIGNSIVGNKSVVKYNFALCKIEPQDVQMAEWADNLRNSS